MLCKSTQARTGLNRKETFACRPIFKGPRGSYPVSRLVPVKKKWKSEKASRVEAPGPELSSVVECRNSVSLCRYFDRHFKRSQVSREEDPPNFSYIAGSVSSISPSKMNKNHCECVTCPSSPICYKTLHSEQPISIPLRKLWQLDCYVKRRSSRQGESVGAETNGHSSAFGMQRIPSRASKPTAWVSP
jgi:hypothetical protein